MFPFLGNTPTYLTGTSLFALFPPSLQSEGLKPLLIPRQQTFIIIRRVECQLERPSGCLLDHLLQSTCIVLSIPFLTTGPFNLPASCLHACSFLSPPNWWYLLPIFLLFCALSNNVFFHSIIFVCFHMFEVGNEFLCFRTLEVRIPYKICALLSFFLSVNSSYCKQLSGHSYPRCLNFRTQVCLWDD